MNAQEQIRIILDNFEDNYDYPYYGIRYQDELYGLMVGDTIMHQSSVWDDGNMTEESLDAVCAVKLSMAAKVTPYYGNNYLLLLGAPAAVDGNDYGEFEMEYPVVLGIYQIDDEY